MKNKEIGLQTSQKFASIKIELVLYQASLDSCLYRRMGTLLSAHLIHMMLTLFSNTDHTQSQRCPPSNCLPSNFHHVGENHRTRRQLDRLNLQRLIPLRILGYVVHQVRLKYRHFSETHKVRPLIETQCSHIQTWSLHSSLI